MRGKPSIRSPPHGRNGYEGFAKLLLDFLKDGDGPGGIPVDAESSGLDRCPGAVVGGHISFPDDDGQRLEGRLLGVVDDGAGDLPRLEGSVRIIDPVRIRAGLGNPDKSEGGLK
jgi:hypothetical protein